MEIQKALGLVISHTRQKKGLSQLKLSEEASLHLNTVQAIESGRYNMKISSVFQIARALEVSVSELMTEVEAKNPSIPTDSY